MGKPLLSLTANCLVYMIGMLSGAPQPVIHHPQMVFVGVRHSGRVHTEQPFPKPGVDGRLSCEWVLA